MAQAVVWFNKGFSSLYSVLDLIKGEDLGGRYHLLCSHSNPEFIGFTASDSYEVEPSPVKDDEYLAYCLDFCDRHEVKMFIPARRIGHLVRNRERFEERGVKMLAAADADTLKIIGNKPALYERLRGENIVPIPDYVVVNRKGSFEAAVERIWEKHGSACFKPSSSIYGRGFRILTKKGREFDRLLNGEALKIGVDYVRALLPEDGDFRDLMVMQYLEGQERSIDCLADRGKLLNCVIRLKPSHQGGSQLLEENPEVSRVAEEITRVLQLDGLFNIQLKDSGGVRYLLEINARMSGGISYACMSGLNLPYWALRLADGSCGHDDIPSPRTGLKVAQVTQGVLARI